MRNSQVMLLLRFASRSFRIIILLARISLIYYRFLDAKIRCRQMICDVKTFRETTIYEHSPRRSRQPVYRAHSGRCYYVRLFSVCALSSRPSINTRIHGIHERNRGTVTTTSPKVPLGAPRLALDLCSDNDDVRDDNADNKRGHALER